MQMLGPDTKTYFYRSAEEGNGYWGSDGFPTDWLKHDSANDLPEVYSWNARLPTYFFAADHSWCFYQDGLTDLIVGCKASLARALLAQIDLEALALTVF